MTGQKNEGDDMKQENEEEEEEDIEALQAEIERMEAEAAKIAEETQALEERKQKAESGEENTNTTGGGNEKNSIYVGQVDYATVPEELVKHFEGCGTIERVTIVCDKFTGKPKGFAYIEFANEASVSTALKLDNSEFKGRNLKITPKRVNVPAFQRGTPPVRGGRPGRGGRSAPFRGGGRGGRGPPFRGGGRGGRGRGGGRGGGFHPYY